MKQPCPRDASHDTSLFSSRERIWCHDCRQFFPWKLKPGQKPVMGNNRIDRKEQTA